METFAIRDGDLNYLAWHVSPDEKIDPSLVLTDVFK
jgi:hypothetical protein